jgi:gliding motility-associated-like protein
MKTPASILIISSFICFMYFNNNDCLAVKSVEIPKNSNTTLRLDSLSVVQNNGHVQLGWTFITDITEGYIEIHRGLETGTFMPITQVPLETNFYIDNGVNANIKQFSYYIVARDINGNSFAVSDVHKTILLNEPLFNICEKRISHSWINYAVTTSAGQPQPLPSPFDKSRLWIKYLDNEWEIAKDFDFDTSRTATFINDEGDYCFYIQSYNSATSQSSSSNIKCIDVELLEIPDFVYLKNIDVITNDIEISVLGDNNAAQPYYVLWKSLNSVNNFQAIDSISTSNDIIVFSDNNVDVFNNQYFYKIEVLDSCRTSVLHSEIGNSILLKSTIVSENENYLLWTHYQGWPTGVESYEIYRKAPNENDFRYLASVNPYTKEHNDYITTDELSGDDPIVYYYIKAVENNGNPYGFKAESYSNVSLVEREINVFIPNAFKPNSSIEINRIFKPNFGFYEPTSYELIIINRWGKIVFSSKDFRKGWDGKFSDTVSPSGIYSYEVKWGNNSGELFSKKGIVHLLD